MKEIVQAAERCGWTVRPVMPNDDQAFACYFVKRLSPSVYLSANKDRVIDNVWTSTLGQMADPTPAKIIEHLEENA